MLHASFLRSVALPQLRFTSFAVVSLWRDFHPQECAHAGRTKTKTPRKGRLCLIRGRKPNHRCKPAWILAFVFQKFRHGCKYGCKKISLTGLTLPAERIKTRRQKSTMIIFYQLQRINRFICCRSWCQLPSEAILINSSCVDGPLTSFGVLRILRDSWIVLEET